MAIMVLRDMDVLRAGAGHSGEADLPGSEPVLARGNILLHFGAASPLGLHPLWGIGDVECHLHLAVHLLDACST